MQNQWILIVKKFRNRFLAKKKYIVNFKISNQKLKIDMKIENIRSRGKKIRMFRLVFPIRSTGLWKPYSDHILMPP